MKKIIYPLALGALLAAPFVLLPGSSRANNPWDNNDNKNDYYRARDVDGKSEWWQRDPRARRMMPGQVPGMPGNSVPLNEGQIFLILAGLGLGAKILYDRRRKIGMA
ncbi:MAG: hypothetical protein J0H74_30930 [Chitinophagaceae bacterium]|nr:hypothetical protein [Chitinophagaceae bacterium]